jgi:hypothetical protein
MTAHEPRDGPPNGNGCWPWLGRCDHRRINAARSSLPLSRSTTIACRPDDGECNVALLCAASSS